MRFLIHIICNSIDKELAEIVGEGMKGPGLSPTDIGNFVGVILMFLEIKIALIIL
jgi:2-keto-4-pentenoate hydratase